MLIFSLNLNAQRTLPGILNNKDKKENDAIPVEKSTSEEKTNTPQTIIPADADIKYSTDSLDAEVFYDAKDSMWYDVINEKIYLFGEAIVKYEEMELTAALIELDQRNNTVTAQGIQDDQGHWLGLPVFDDGSQNFTAKKMKYNFKTEKGIIYEGRTQQDDLYIHSEVLKYQKFKQDSLSSAEDDLIYSMNALFTTCNHDHPHFGIRSTKQKIITDKLIVVGPSNLEIAGVKTPLWMPFGFFPITKGKRSGILFPNNFDTSGSLGFGVANLGYYWGINDHLDFQITGDLYTRGTWRVKTRMRYNVKYKYSGDVALEYAWLNNGEQPNSLEKNILKTFLARWSFKQSNKAHPTRNFSANVTYQLNDAIGSNYNDVQSVLNNQTQSNISFTQRFPGKPFTLSASIQQSQNTRTRDFSLRAPDLRFDMNRIFPFKSKKGGKDKWYEKINVNYNLRALGNLQTKDSLLLDPETWQDYNYGLQHKTSTGASFRIANLFNISPSFNYSESWFFNTIEKDYVGYSTFDTIYNINPITQDTVQEINETINYETIIDDVKGFKAYRDISSSVSVNTEVYSTLQFKSEKAFIKGIRYIARPSASFNYRPDYTDERWGYFKNYDKEGTTTRYSVFEGNVFGLNPSSNESMNVSFLMNNSLEIKHRAKKDTINEYKIFKLFDNLNMGTNFNFVKDSLKWDPISMRTNLRFAKGVFNIGLNAAFDPYIENENGTRINTTRWDAEKRLLRFDFLNINTSTSIGWRDIKKWFGLNSKNNESSDKGNTSNTGRDDNQQAGGIRNNGLFGNNAGANVQYSSNFIGDVGIRYIFNTRITEEGAIISSNNLTLNTTFNLSPKWQLRMSGFGYDFNSKSLTYASIDISRDLHCWEMGLSWFPDRQVYSFFLRVKPGSLQFINVPWGQNQLETGVGGRL